MRRDFSKDDANSLRRAGTQEALRNWGGACIQGHPHKQRPATS